MSDQRARYVAVLKARLQAALRSPNLEAWATGQVPDVRLHPEGRYMDPDIAMLEDVLLEHGLQPDNSLNLALVTAFAQAVQAVCTDENELLYTSYNGIGWLLAGWRGLASTRLKDGDGREVLLACVAAATGVHAAAFLAIEAGTNNLMELASSPLRAVRMAVPEGLGALLAVHWDRTLHELRRAVIVGDAFRHLAVIRAVSRPELLSVRAHALDALDLHHAILAARRRQSPDARLDEAGRLLRAALPGTIGALLMAERLSGFAAARTWMAWGDPDIVAIVHESATRQPIASYEEAAYLRQRFS